MLIRKIKVLLILSVDQSKAFDRVSHKFVIQTLETLGFGSFFVSWVKLLYMSPFVKVNINRNLSRINAYRRGLRHSVLFVTALICHCN